ncbi:MAG: hypothetical protein RML40_07760 [Bacteroidota bacterium]|nr:hypothetical protein [Candidatus Kapabacteria bacterium]MDW8220410.1 hypothetical protein [Bacteroidota bacterium]
MPEELSPSISFSNHPLNAVDIIVLRGANAFAWSPVVRMLLDLGEYDEVFTNSIDGFADTLEALLPSLYEHHCSVGSPGGFFQRLREGTLLGHVLEHIALELQVLAGMDVTYGKTRSTKQKGVYTIVFSYVHEEAGLLAARAALAIVNGILTHAIPNVQTIVQSLRDIAERNTPSFITQELLAEARRRSLPILRFKENDANSFWIGTGKHAWRVERGIVLPKRFSSASTSHSSTYSSLSFDTLAVLEQEITRSCIRALHLPFVASLQHSLHAAPVNTYRILLLNGSAPSVVKLAPPVVEGNGQHTIRELIEMMNVQRRSSGRLQPVHLDEASIATLAEYGFSPDDVLSQGTVVRVQHEGLPEYGGAVIEVNDDVCADNMNLFARIAEHIRVQYRYTMAELRLSAPSLRYPLLREASSAQSVSFYCSLQPDIRLYRLPTSGRTYNVALHLLAAMFPSNTSASIPCIAITAGLGANFLCTMLDDALTAFGYTVGTASPHHAFIHHEKLTLRANSGLYTVLTEPDVDCAVLDIPLDTLLRDGLCYPRATVGILLNTTSVDVCEYEDPVLETDDDILQASALIAEYLIPGGTAIINANYSHITRSVQPSSNTTTIFFATHRQNPHLALHCSRGGRALLLEEGTMRILEGKYESVFVEHLHLESTLDKELVLALVATLFAIGIPHKTLQDWLPQAIDRLCSKTAVFEDIQV